MTKQTINIGQSVNDKHGDPIRTAFDKVNQNFTELYSAIGADVQIPVQTGNSGKFLITDGTTLSWSTIPVNTGDLRFVSNAMYNLGGAIVENADLTHGATASVIVPGNGTSDALQINNTYGPVSVISGATNVTKSWTFGNAGHLVPGSDILQDIGTPLNRVRHIYVGPGSITVGASVITESATGKLVLPGVTRATGFHASEIQDTSDQTYQFSPDRLIYIIDHTYYLILTGGIQPSSGSYVNASYAAQSDGEGYLGDIGIASPGSGWTQGDADTAKLNGMWAYAGVESNPFASFVSNDWVQIPFVVYPQASDTEYEFSTSGSGSDRLVNGDSQLVLGSDGTLTLSPVGNIVQPALTLGPFNVLDGNSYPGYFEIYFSVSDIPNLDQLFHEGDRMVDGTDDNNFVTITRPIVSSGESWIVVYTASWPTPNPQTVKFEATGGTWKFGSNGTLTAPGNIVVGSSPFNVNQNESHFIIDAGNYWTSIQWKNFTSPQDPSATPFECQAQLLRVFASESTVTAVCNIDNPREELVAVTAVRPNNTNYNGIMISTSNGKIPDAPYNDGQGTRHDWVFGGDAKLTTPQGGTNTTSSIGQGPDSDWVNPNNNTWSIRTYNGGTSFTYEQGQSPTVWWDADNSPLGGNQFRGAIIEYHAYVSGNGNGTIVGQLIIAQDQTVEPTHTENLSFYGTSAGIKVWERPNWKQIGYSNSTLSSGQIDNVMIMWTAKVFYGQEFAC